MGETPVYISGSTVKSLWQEYRVYDDRVEFDSLFGRLTIPFEQVESVEISPSDLGELLRGELHLREFRPALKLDWANFVEHVVLDKNVGIVKRVLFTPDDVVAFKAAMDEALNRYRSLQER